MKVNLHWLITIHEIRIITSAYLYRISSRQQQRQNYLNLLSSVTCSNYKLLKIYRTKKWLPSVYGILIDHVRLIQGLIFVIFIQISPKYLSQLDNNAGNGNFPILPQILQDGPLSAIIFLRSIKLILKNFFNNQKYWI